MNTCLLEPIVHTGRNVGLDVHLSGRHHVCVGVGVETRGGYHELHDGSITL